MGYRFEWDRRKATANRKKHAVSFEEAITVFGDPFSMNMPDPDRSEGEQRFTLTCGGSEGDPQNSASSRLKPTSRAPPCRARYPCPARRGTRRVALGDALGKQCVEPGEASAQSLQILFITFFPLNERGHVEMLSRWSL